MNISEAFKTWRKDLNEEDSMTLHFFAKITSWQFKFTILLGIPLLLYLLLFL
ncbi:hypothetical protein PZE06_17185 [Robertmurraya sp. DFI.2.37]|jgi:hypothetical protein|uniref:hypothetical protein n=1 Tax=Robertmurraya sp. DFI.2.37 TaxID=3031819 RepID=UPI0017875F6B|nr:hypothetical protein [Robertmurraya sp. DFI.2.37]MDF1509878.1 hypothetical protein [Robertmurraya sp. DFI.2.37]